jgi:hypothetical protein
MRARNGNDCSSVVVGIAWSGAARNDGGAAWLQLSRGFAGNGHSKSASVKGIHMGFNYMVLYGILMDYASAK